MTFRQWWLDYSKNFSLDDADSLRADFFRCWDASNINATLRTAKEIKFLIAKIKVLEKQNSDMGWKINPDRMGGGGWTEEEKSDVYGWK